MPLHLHMMCEYRFGRSCSPRSSTTCDMTGTCRWDSRKAAPAAVSAERPSVSSLRSRPRLALCTLRSFPGPLASPPMPRWHVAVRPDNSKTFLLSSITFFRRCLIENEVKKLVRCILPVFWHDVVNLESFGEFGSKMRTSQSHTSAIRTHVPDLHSC